MSGQILSDGRNDGPLCPGSSSPANPAHLLAVEIADRVYEAAKPWQDDDGEYPEGTGLDEAVAAAQPSDRMRLYTVDQAGMSSFGARLFQVKAYFWRCPVCGLVLPATEG